MNDHRVNITEVLNTGGDDTFHARCTTCDWVGMFVHVNDCGDVDSTFAVDQAENIAKSEGINHIIEARKETP